jgi:hypothetical protein
MHPYTPACPASSLGSLTIARSSRSKRLKTWPTHIPMSLEPQRCTAKTIRAIGREQVREVIGSSYTERSYSVIKQLQVHMACILSDDLKGRSWWVWTFSNILCRWWPAMYAVHDSGVSRGVVVAAATRTWLAGVFSQPMTGIIEHLEG